jgi:hypothetical protein
MLAVAAVVLKLVHLANRRQEVVLVVEVQYHQQLQLLLQLQQIVAQVVAEEHKVQLALLHLKAAMVLLVLLLLNIHHIK